jgi:hypothetical protein
MRSAVPLAVTVLAISVFAAQLQRFAIAIVRPDGAIVPFAAYDSGRWEQAWPEADEATAIRAIDDAPSVWSRRRERVPNTWQVWPASEEKSIRAQVSGIEIVEARCSGQLALKTNLPPARADHPLKYGIAVDSSDVVVGRSAEVRRPDSIWASAERAVLSSFSSREIAQATRRGEQLPREIPVPAPQLTALYRETTSPRSPLYFVAEKKYRTARSPQDPKCGAVTMMTGWLVPSDAGTYTVVDPRMFLTDCDAKEARTGLPLAAFRVSGQLFWVLQEHGYEDETYLIAEIRQSDIRYPIEANGGGC